MIGDRAQYSVSFYWLLMLVTALIFMMFSYLYVSCGLGCVCQVPTFTIEDSALSQVVVKTSHDILAIYVICDGCYVYVCIYMYVANYNYNNNRLDMGGVVGNFKDFRWKK